ncbi:ATP-binding cassette domain-containing protein [Frankia sp. CiP3]|uniref:ATP-binding cassette domain-containing protein n=1 Tax=Frankia sp. CiP3 TaxID=2880971 RepID=UPI001EF4D2E8|nr:ATP-binding cassette domain-containing protein [Frankia sp. CiP3]
MKNTALLASRPHTWDASLLRRSVTSSPTGATVGNAPGAANAGRAGNPADASLAPVTIGLINQQGAEVGYPDLTDGATAAVTYVNAELGIPVVHGLNLRVNAGEIVALLGPNGAGKTTTLLTVSGLLPVIGGTIGFQSRSIAGARPDVLARRGLAHIPEDRALFMDLTVRENLWLAGGRRAAHTECALAYFPALTQGHFVVDRQSGSFVVSTDA